MTTKRTMKLAASALILGGTLVAAMPNGVLGGNAIAYDATKAQRIAHDSALKAQKALKARDMPKAIKLAEQAVESAPNDAGYRALLGQVYLQAGRLVSAEASFHDAVTLYPEDGRSTLSLALVQIALGKPEMGLQTIDGSRTAVAPADHGLALALAGDVQGAITMLQAAAREEGASIKVRQNLALSHALAGHWSEARAIAAQDLPADQLDRRMLSWAGFAMPRNSWDQVAALLEIKPVLDVGQPERLALAPQPAATVQLAEAEPAAAEPEAIVEPPVLLAAAEPEPETAAEPAEAPALLAAAAPVPSAGAMLQQVVFAPRREVVQAYAAGFGATGAPAKPQYSPIVAARPAVVQAGNFVVQLGAFSSAAKAESAWGQASGRFGLRAYAPDGVTFQKGKATLHRVAAGGFATRQDALRVCGTIKAKGGSCFVRAATKDAPARWALRAMSTRLASR